VGHEAAAIIHRRGGVRVDTSCRGLSIDAVAVVRPKCLEAQCICLGKSRGGPVLAGGEKEITLAVLRCIYDARIRPRHRGAELKGEGVRDPINDDTHVGCRGTRIVLRVEGVFFFGPGVVEAIDNGIGRIELCITRVSGKVSRPVVFVLGRQEEHVARNHVIRI
jgi:hypothetical protein